MNVEAIVILIIIIITIILILINIFGVQDGIKNNVGYSESAEIFIWLTFTIIISLCIMFFIWFRREMSCDTPLKTTIIKSITEPINVNIDKYKKDKLGNIDLFNLSVIKSNGKFIGLLRGYNHTKRYSHPLYLEIKDNEISKLELININDHDFTGLKDNCGIEDPRIFIFRNEYWVIANSLGHKDQLHKDINTMCMFKLADPNNNLKFLYHPVKPNIIQKNWSPFEHDGKLYCEYSLEPRIIYQIDADSSKIVEIFENENYYDFYDLARHGRLSGGSPPILITYLREDYYLGIGRLVTKDHSYYHFFYMFEARPPFNMIGNSKLFKLDGNERIQFVGGMSIENDNIYVSYGINDKHNRISIFNKYDINNMINYHSIKNYSDDFLKLDNKLLVPGQTIDDIYKKYDIKGITRLRDNYIIDKNSIITAKVRDVELPRSLISYFDHHNYIGRFMSAMIKPRSNIISNNKYKIPKIIHQSFETNLLPDCLIQASNSWISVNPDYEYRYYNDLNRRNLIVDYFNNDVVRAYDSLIPGAYRCDLWRFCAIYIYGGIYADIKTGAVRPIKDIIDPDDDYIFVNDLPNGTILNGFFGAKAKDSLVLKVIQTIVVRVLGKEYGDSNLYPTGPSAVGAAILPELGYQDHLPVGGYKIKDKQFRIYDHLDGGDYSRIMLSDSGTKLVKFRHNKQTANVKYFTELTGRLNYGELWEQRKIYS